MLYTFNHQYYMRKAFYLFSKTKFLSVILVLSSVLPSQAISDKFTSGEGTISSPYIIQTAEQIQNITLYRDAYFQLGNNIDLTEWINTNNPEKGWESLCPDESMPFTGQLDGAGYAITGLWFNRPTDSHIGGLFSWVGTNAVIKNLILKTTAQGIIGGSDVGGIVGRISNNATDILINNCFADVHVKGTTNSGGILGYSYTGGVTISNCYVSGQVTAKNSNAGGIAGQLWNKADFIIQNCYTTANIISENADCVGGIVGTIGGPSVDKAAHITLKNCVAINPLLQISSSSTENSIGHIIGRLVKKNTTGTIENNIALKETKLIKDGTNIKPENNTIENDGTTQNIHELIEQTVYLQLGWDFTNIWTMPNKEYSFPILSQLSTDEQPIKLSDELNNLLNTPKIEFEGGDGSEASPYIIKTATQLHNIGIFPNAHYKLSGNIDLTEWIYANSPETGWIPLCSLAEPFTGTLDGNGFAITGLWIDMPTTNETGLFSYVGGNAIIKNLGVKTLDKGIRGKENIGAIVGRIKENANAEIKNCYADACIIGEKSCGGILGYSYKGNVIISDCYSSGNISINTEGAGGIAGYLWNKAEFVIRNCYSTSKINATGDGYNIGGLLGIVGGPGTSISATITIENCVAINPSISFEATSETAQTRIGRIAGWIKDGTVNATIRNNRALSDIKLIRGTETLNAESNASGKDGLNSTASDLKKEDLYLNLEWNFISIWNMSNEKYPLPILSGMDIANQPKTLPEELAKIFSESTTGISTVSNNLIDIIIKGNTLIIRNKLPENIVSIFDITGKHMLDTYESRIELNNFPKGIYILNTQKQSLKFSK